MTGYFANKILVTSLWKKGSLKASFDNTLEANVESDKKKLEIFEAHYKTDSLCQIEKALKD